MTVAEQIRTVQLALGITPDGVPGPVTWRAIHARICGEFAKQPRSTQNFTVDSRSAKNISGLVEPLQRTAEAFLERCQAEGLGVKIICGLRTFAEQDALYAQGRTVPGTL
jgi:peptidoglycan L-alanyl-D-glutamate endopeptidase CwlK